MPIEFSCPHCDHRLRTADDKAGLSAKCPACGEMIWVPYSQPTAPDDAPGTLPPVPPPVPDDPLGSPAVPAAPGVGAGGAADSGPPPEAEEDDILEDAFEPAPPRAKIAAAEVICPGCQASNEAGAGACRFCGTSLEGVEPPLPEAEWAPPRFDISEVLSTVWRIYRQEIGLLVGSMLVYFLSIIVLELVVGAPMFIIGMALQDDALYVLIPLAILVIPVFLAVILALTIGQQRLYLNVARGPGASIGDLFFAFRDGRRFLLRGALVFVTAGAMMVLGMLLCCAPGILVALSWWPAMPLLLDRDPPGGNVVGDTIEFVKLRFGEVLAVGAITMGIQVASSMIPYLSIILQLFVVPFAGVVFMVAYLRMTEQKTAID